MKNLLLLVTTFFYISASSQSVITYTLDQDRFFHYADLITIEPTVDTSDVDSLILDREIGDSVWIDAWSQQKLGKSGYVEAKYNFADDKWNTLNVQVQEYGTVTGDTSVGFYLGDTMNVKFYGYKNGSFVDSVEFILPVGYPVSIQLRHKTNRVTETVSVYDIAGRMISTRNNSPGSKQLLQGLPAGMYIIRTKYDDGSSDATKTMKY